MNGLIIPKRDSKDIFKKFRNMLFIKRKPENYDVKMLKIKIRKIEWKTVIQNLLIINVSINQVGFKEEIGKVNHSFLLSCSKLDEHRSQWQCSHSVMSDSLWPHGLQSARLLCPVEFSRQEYWNDYHSLLQGIFLSRDGSQASHIIADSLLSSHKIHKEGIKLSPLKLLKTIKGNNFLWKMCAYIFLN